MSIKADGERSRQRMVYAKRLIGKLGMLGTPSQALLRDGFSFKATKIDNELSSATIRAPMGAVVACSQDTGVQLVIADYWASAFDKVRDAYVVVYAESHPAQDYWVVVSPNTTLGNAKFTPKATTTFYGDPAEEYPDTPPTPSISAYAGETYWVGLSGKVDDHSAHVYEAKLNFYSASGEEPERICVFADSRIDVGAFSVQNVAAVSMRQVAHKIGAYQFLYLHPDNYLLCALATFGQTDTFGYNPFLGSVMFSGAPTGLQALMLAYPDNDTAAIGSYAYASDAVAQPTLLHCVDTTDVIGFGSYYAVNPTHEPWKLFFSLYTYGEVSISTRTVDTALLHTISPVPVVVAGVVNWSAARDILWQFFPWPNNNRTVPSDSAMFHDDAGNVYSWTRKYGTMRFSRSGMTAVGITVPSIVASTDGVRPEIYLVYSGRYICVAYQPGYLTDPPDGDDHIGVRAVYFGSPFGSWSVFPDAPVGYRMLSVRVVQSDAQFSVMLAILTDASSYRFATMRYNHADSTGVWQVLGELPITVADVDRTNWAIGIFGDDPHVSSLAAIAAHPPCLPQMAVAPYEKYVGVIP